MSAEALLLIVAAVHLAPLHVAGLTGGSHAAWETVGFGVESFILWAWVGMTRAALDLVARAISTWAAGESMQRAACRLMLPMDRKPALGPGQNLCDAATGLPVSLISLAALAIVVMVLAGSAKRGGF